MRLCARLLFLLLLPLAARADHITGGEMFYTLLGTQNGMFQYRVTAKVFMRCNSGRQFNNPAIISIFEKGSGARLSDHQVNLSRTETLQLSNPNRCITDPPVVCYNVGYYDFDVSLPGSATGYQVVSQFVYRIAGIRNLVSFYNNIGATYTGEIPANINGAAENNSARFVGSDLVAICANNNFSYSFAAEDPDGDELRYSFCDAYQGGTFRTGTASPPTTPPYDAVPYNNAFSGGAPLGPDVRINTQTGLITGVAPGDGIYVVTVCVEEIRNGRVIAIQRKDLQIFIASCTIAAASLQPAYDLCRDTKTLSVSNLSTSPLIRTYNWELTGRDGRSFAQGTDANFTHTFADTGTYQLKLVINRGGDCADSNQSPVRVYPGLVPSFDFEGVCATNPTRFTDRSTTVYGTITNWSWNFGSQSSDVEEAFLATQNPIHQFRGNGARQVVLRVNTSLGCTDTVSRIVAIVDRPPLDLAFRDTTICINDEVQLQARSSGNYRGMPADGMQNSNVPNPVVKPRATTLYVAELNDHGCFNQDSVLVRVENGVRLQVMADTTICAGDTIRLRTHSNALRYAWQSTDLLLQPDDAANLMVAPRQTTRYQVTGTIGGCTASAFVEVRAVPYPKVNAGADTAICFGTQAFLQGSTDGIRAAWSVA